jgi:hypothetical protein
MNIILDSFDNKKVRCSGCGKYIDKEKAHITRHYEIIRVGLSQATILYWCKESFNNCTKLYSESIQNKIDPNAFLSIDLKT